jgi:serine/threonine protein kinase
MSDEEGKIPTHDDLLMSLADTYQKRHKESEFEEEKPIFEILVPRLADILKPLILVRAFALGSTATVWEVLDDRLNQRRALKLPRPRLGKLDKIIRVITAEKDKLARLTHQNIIKIYLSDEIPITINKDEYSFPFFLMDYLDGVMDIDDFISANIDRLTAEGIISYFRHVANGLSFLHSRHVVHCDIKPGNLIIAPDSPALIADLGYAKHFYIIQKDDQEKLTTVTYTPTYAHPSLAEKMVRSSDSAANIATIKQSDLTPAFDLYSFGRTIQTILRIVRSKESGDWLESIFTPYQWRYLALIAVRLLDGQVLKVTNDPLDSDAIPDLPPDLMKEFAYESADQALEDLEKLLNLYDLEGEVPELNSNLSNYIQLPGSRVPFTRRVSRITNHPSFVRLTQVSQLGFVSLVYPGATHSRFEHSLGTFEKCCEMIRALWYDETNCLFRSVMSKADIEGVLLAALLHDIGQFPMAHDLSEVSGVFGHDRFTESMIEALDSYTGESIADIIHSEWDAEVNNVFSILKANESSRFRDRILKSIISGPIDADKLDYLDRDCIHSGVTFGGDIDRGRLLRNLTLCYSTKDGLLDVAEIGVLEKAHTVAESIWRARIEMFRQVYWHHTVRSLKAMLTYVVRRIIIAHKSSNTLDDMCGELNQFCMSPACGNALSVGTVNRSVTCNLPESSVEESISPDEAFLIPYSHLSANDDALISFLWAHSDALGQQVLQMIRHRQLYSRIAVVSHSIEEHIFDSIYTRFREERLRGFIVEQEARRETLERVILGKCGIDDASRIYDEIDNQVPLVLFDVPLKALRDPPAKEGLRYIPEEKLGFTNKDTFRKHSVAQSKIEIENTAFDKFVGKIRVFAHPKIQRLILAHMTSQEIISCLVKT